MSAVVHEFRRLAVLDRGVGGLRLVNAARELRREGALDLTIVAIHQNGDETARFVREADEALSFGAATFVDDRDGRRKSSYLDEARVEQALLAVRADAVAAGVAPVAVQAALSRLCSRLGLVFVGPAPAPLELLADEIAVKRLAAELQLQVAPWSGRAVASHAEAMWHAEQLGFPLRIRSATGSGDAIGRTVRCPGEVIAAFEDVRAQAIAALGDATVLFAQDGAGARRCAVQVLADQHGSCWVAGVIDRTLERGQRPIISESPPPGLSHTLEGALREIALRLATASGFRGAACFEFRCDPASSTGDFVAADPRLADEHTVLEASTGVDLVKLQLRLARGDRLAVQLPAPRGHALSVRLAAEDAENQLAPAPGVVELLRLPSGAGLCVDGGVAAGDIIPRDDPTIARVTAFGHDRLEALARLERALRDCAVVVRGSATNKAVLLDLLEQPELRHGQPDDGWLDRRASRDPASAPRHADVALLSAAIDAYDADFAVERTMFLAAAARGRPYVKHDVGVAVALRLRGQAYRFAVARVGPRDYRITADGATQRVRVERAGEFESRLRLDGTAFRILSVGYGLERLVEVDGVPHRMADDAGGIVRAGGPAVVLAILVQAGDTVAAGDRLMILEAMKMEMPVLAPFAGRVREILVAPNVQVDVGAALVVVEPPAAGAPASSVRVSFAAAAQSAIGAGVDARSGWTGAYDEARRLMLGFDVDRAAAKRLAARWPTLATADAELLRAEAELLDAFTTIHALFRPQRDPDELGGHEARAVQEYLLSYLRALDAQGEGLPPSFLAKLERALALHGVIGLTRTRALEDALVHIYRARERAEEQAELMLGILSRLLAGHADLAGVLGSDFQALLHRLIAVSHGRFPAIGDLAREVRHRAFDEPLFTRAREEVYASARGTLARLLVEGDPDVRRRLLQDLVECPQPLVGLLTRRLESAPSASRDLMLEVLTRRYYRMRRLENLRFQSAAGQTCALSEYELDGRRLSLLTTFASYAELAVTLCWTCAAIAALPPSQDVILDLFVRRAAPLGDADATAAELRALVEQTPWPRPLRRIVFAIAGEGGGPGMGSMQHFTYRPATSGSGYTEDPLYRGLHPMMGKRMHLWRLANFAIERLPSVEDVYLFRGVAHANPQDERLLALAEVRDLTPVRDVQGRVVQLPHLERMLVEALAAIRQQQVRRPPRSRLLWNRVLLYVWPTLDLARAELDDLVRRLAPITEGLGIEQVMVRARVPDPAGGALVDTVLRIARLGAQGGLDVTWDVPPIEPLRPLGPYEQKVLSLRRRGLSYPYEIVRSLTAPPDHAQPGLPPGDFVEYDLDGEGRLVPVARPYGENTAHLVVGLIRNHTVKYPDGMRRVILLGDPSKEMGSVAEPECRRIMEALALARRLQVPVEWFTLSAGAKISMDSGTENMDWISRVLRHLIEFTQEGREVNVVVVGINVGAQPYWNAEATMLMHTRGILVMTPESAMVLTGKQALDYSGSVSAEDNQGIGGYERVMGQNGQAQYWAGDLGEACRILLRHYEHTYVAPGERAPRRAATVDPPDRDVRSSPHGTLGDTGFVTVGDVVSEEHNRGRKKPFEIRRVMAAVIDRDHEPLERWPDMCDAEIAVVWDAHLGGYPVCLIGMESHPLRRPGFVPADGPTQWTAGTLFPRSSKKIARTINAASGNRPIVVLANLSGFDGSPESMRNLQLEYGAEIGRAVVNFRGPIVFCVVSRYHGGAFVVFSKALNESFEAAALEGAYASVIGGAPAAAVVFARDVDERTRTDVRVATLEQEIAAAAPDEKAALRARLAATLKAVHAEKLGEVADEFDHVHTVQRALRVGSLDHIVPPARLRPYLIEALERGLRTSGDPR